MEIFNGITTKLTQMRKVITKQTQQTYNPRTILIAKMSKEKKKCPKLILQIIMFLVAVQYKKQTICGIRCQMRLPDQTINTLKNHQKISLSIPMKSMRMITIQKMTHLMDLVKVKKEQCLNIEIIGETEKECEKECCWQSLPQKSDRTVHLNQSWNRVHILILNVQVHVQVRITMIYVFRDK